jgi:hypothetical protein
MRLWLGVGVLLAALAVAGALGTSGSAAAGTCSTAEAETLAGKYDMGDANYGRVGQVLCGPFTGSQSNAMAFSFHWYGCIPVQGWAVFLFSGNAWQLVLRRDREVAVLAAAGSDIRTTVDVFRSGDSHCVPTGGRRSRLWHWDGKQLGAGPWTQVTPPKAGGARSAANFVSPSRNLACQMMVTDVFCESVKPRHSVTMSPDAKLNICRGAVCFRDFDGLTPTLAYGKQKSVGRFRCSSLRAGVKCVVISSARGFLINASGVAKIR